MNNKIIGTVLCIAFFYTCQYKGMTVYIDGLPANAQFVTMQKTILNHQVRFIDVLFSTNNQEHYFWQYNIKKKQSRDIKTTNASYITDSINNGQNRAIAVGNKYVNGLLTTDLYPTFQFHDKSIVKMKHDANYLVTQSTAQNIRFWPKDQFQFVPSQKTTKDIIAKEISRSYLLDYVERNAIWAQKDWRTRTILSIHIGFNFSEQAKSFIFKNNIYDFVETKEIISIPYIQQNYMPACFLAKDHAALFNEYKKESIILTYTETEKKEKESTKKIGTIQSTSINLQKMKPIISDDNPAELLYHTPKKIDYNNADKKILLIYDDRIIRCESINNEYTYKTILNWSNEKMYIVDAIVHDHTILYALFYDQQQKKYFLYIYQLSA
jgi:hypothetical protein